MNALMLLSTKVHKIPSSLAQKVLCLKMFNVLTPLPQEGAALQIFSFEGDVDQERCPVWMLRGPWFPHPWDQVEKLRNGGNAIWADCDEPLSNAHVVDPILKEPWKKTLVFLGVEGDYTTQLYGDYNKPL